MTVKCTPKKKNNRHITLTAVFSALVVAAVALIVLEIGNKLTFQLIAVVAMVGMIWSLMKFYLTERTYTLTDHYGPMMLIVTQTQGKRTSTVFETRISSIKDVGEITGDSNEKIPSGMFYDFRVTFGSKAYQYIVTRTIDRSIVVKLEADPEFWQLLIACYKSHLENALSESSNDDYSDEEE